MPHLALCFAALFGEPPIAATAVAAAAATGGVSDSGKGCGRAEKLRGRLLGALEVRVGARGVVVVGCGRRLRLGRTDGLSGDVSFLFGSRSLFVDIA